MIRHADKAFRTFFAKLERQGFQECAQSPPVAALGHPLKRQLLRLGDLRRRHFGCDNVAGVDGCVPLAFPQSWKLRGCLVQPHMRLHIILGTPLPSARAGLEARHAAHQQFFQRWREHVETGLYIDLAKDDPNAPGYIAFPNDCEDRYFQELISESRARSKRWDRLFGAASFSASDWRGGGGGMPAH
jgi:hypothetical protein